MHIYIYVNPVWLFCHFRFILGVGTKLYKKQTFFPTCFLRIDPTHQKDHQKAYLSNELDAILYIPDAPCMEYLPTFTINLSQM